MDARFRVKTVVGEERFDGTVSAAGVRLRGVDEQADSNSPRMTLLRKKESL